MTDSLEAVLRNHRFLEELEGGQVRFLGTCGRQVRFDSGQYLLREGERANALYLIVEGRVALEIHVPGRGATQVESLGPGDVLGLSWLYPPYRWQLDARATEPVRATALDGDCLRERMEADHDLGYAILKALVHDVYHRLMRVRQQRLDLYREHA